MPESRNPRFDLLYLIRGGFRPGSVMATDPAAFRHATAAT